MHIRHATRADIAQVVDIAVITLAEEPIYAHLFPYRDAFPQDYRADLARKYTAMLNTPGQVILVVTSDEDSRQVLAYAGLVRYGSRAAQSKWAPDTIGKKLRRSYAYLWSFFTRDRASSPSNIASYYAQATAIRNMPAESDFIDFQTLVVHPKHQRKGYGDGLMAWSGRAALLEGVPIFGSASAIAVPLYLRYGAKHVGDIALPQQILDARHGGHEQRLGPTKVAVLKWDLEVLAGLAKLSF